MFALWRSCIKGGELLHGNLAFNSLLPFRATPEHKAMFCAVSSNNSEGVWRYGDEVQEACPAEAEFPNFLQRDREHVPLDIEDMRFEDEPFGCKVESPADGFQTSLEVCGAFPYKGFVGEQWGFHGLAHGRRTSCLYTFGIDIREAGSIAVAGICLVFYRPVVHFFPGSTGFNPTLMRLEPGTENSLSAFCNISIPHWCGLNWFQSLTGTIQTRPKKYFKLNDSHNYNIILFSPKVKSICVNFIPPFCREPP